MVVTLIHPIAMDDGLRFAIREGGRTVGAGVVAKFWANYTLISFELKGRFGALFAARNLSSKYLVVILLAELWRK